MAMRYFDLYHGVELKPERSGDKAVLSLCARSARTMEPYWLPTISTGRKDYRI